jgi:O-antigen/teichoic acid export membrane protein
MAGKAAELVTLVVLATVVPRAVGAADYGRFALPLTLVTLGSLALTLGGPTLLARFVPAAAPEERLALARAIGARLARGRAIQLVVIAVGAGVAAAAWPDRFDPFTTAVVVASLVLSVATTLALQVPLGLGRTGPWATRYPLQNAVLIVAVLVLHAVAGDEGAVLAILLSTAVAALYALAVVRPMATSSAPSVAVPPGAIRFGALQAAGAALVQVAQRGGVVAVAVLVGSDTEVGYAALAVGISLGVTYAVLQAFTVSLPHLADGHAGGVQPEREATLRRLAGTLLLVIGPAGIIVAVALDRLVPLVFGDDFRGAVDAFGPAVALVVLAPAASLLVQVAALRLRPRVALANGVATGAVFLLAAVLVVPAWEAAGATAAALAGTAAGLAVSTRLLRGALGGRLLVASGVLAALVLVAAA